MEEAPFRCLRCGHEFKAPYDKKVPLERACPKCNSNSVRRIKVTGKARPEPRPELSRRTGEGDAKA